MNKLKANLPAENLDKAIIRDFLDQLRSANYRSVRRDQWPWIFQEMMTSVKKRYDIQDEEALNALLNEAWAVYKGQKSDAYKTDEEIKRADRVNEIGRQMLLVRTRLVQDLAESDELAALIELRTLAAKRGYLKDPDPAFDMIAIRNMNARIAELEKSKKIG